MKLRVTVNGVTYDVDVDILEDMDYAAQVTASAPAPVAPSAPVRPPVSVTPQPAVAGANVLASSIPGTVVEINVTPGQAVKIGEQLMVLDAMKMNTQVTATADGVVKAIHANVGDAVKMGQALISFE